MKKAPSKSSHQPYTQQAPSTKKPRWVRTATEAVSTGCTLKYLTDLPTIIEGRSSEQRLETVWEGPSCTTSTENLGLSSTSSKLYTELTTLNYPLVV